MSDARSPQSMILVPYQRRAVGIAVQATIIVLTGLLLYVVLPGHPPVHLVGYLSLIAAAFVGVLFVNSLPWQRLFEAGYGQYVLYAWSFADIVLISVAMVLSGGQRSEVFLTYLLTTVFFAASYPLRGQIGLFVATVLSYLGVLAVTEAHWDYASLAYRLVALTAVMFISSFLSRELSGQMQAHGIARSDAERRSSLFAEVARSARSLHNASADRILQITADTARRLGFDYAAIAVGKPGDGGLELVAVAGDDAAGEPGGDEASGRALGALPDAPLHLVLPIETEAAPPMSLLLLSERTGQPSSDEHEALDLLLSRAGRALDTAGHSDELQRRERRFRSLLQYSSDLITLLDERGEILYQSDSSQAMLGDDPSPMTGRSFEEVVHPADVEKMQALIAEIMVAGGAAPRSVQLRVRTPSGWRHVEILATNRLADPAVQGIVLNGRDVSEHVRLTEQLREQALHDPLTGLPNRTLLSERLDRALDSRVPGRGVGLLFIDLDDFKRVNDLFGHAAGDRFLMAVSDYFRGAIRPEDTAARFGGDEFVLVMTDVSGPDEVQIRARRLLAELATSVAVPMDGLVFTASAGLVVVDYGDDVAPAEILYRADIAMYHAKRNGKARFAIFDENMADAVRARHNFELELRAAVERDEFELHYQPTVALSSGTITGVEALVRWQHPTLGLLPPKEFVPLAEEVGIITGLGRIVLERSIAEFCGWRREHPELGNLRLNVNISPTQLRNPSLPGEIRTLLERHGLPPHLLVIEMTEEALAGEVEEAAQALHALKALGLRIAVDDFGTGYSSLAYLHAFPLDMLKIDRSFVTRLGRDDGETLIAAIVELASSLRLEATAEGIESEAQLQYLRNRGCALGQGFHLARPLAGPAVLDLILNDVIGGQDVRASA